MRQVAVALKTDLNTVRHAYDELARSGAITVIKARGTYVQERPPTLSANVVAAQMDDLAHQPLRSPRSERARLAAAPFPPLTGAR